MYDGRKHPMAARLEPTEFGRHWLDRMASDRDVVMVIDDAESRPRRGVGRENLSIKLAKRFVDARTRPGGDR